MAELFENDSPGSIPPIYSPGAGLELLAGARRPRRSYEPSRERKGRPRSRSSARRARRRRASVPPPRGRRIRTPSAPRALPEPRALDRRASGRGDPPLNRWSPDLEAVARRTMKQASGFAWMYERLVFRAKAWGSYLTILTGLLSGVVGTGGLVSAFYEAPQWAGILTAAVGYAITVVVVLDKTWRLDVVRSEGLVAQVGFAHLNRSIMFQLALHPSERQDAHEFVKGALIEIETLKLSSPTIDAKIRDLYVAKFQNNPIYNPSDQWEDYRQSWESVSSDGGDCLVGPETAARCASPRRPGSTHAHASINEDPPSRGTLEKMLEAYELSARASPRR